jgi:hypothetical protein
MSDEPYVRTDEEVEHQRDYENREASRHNSVAQVHYRVIEGKGGMWRVGRQVSEGAEQMSAWFPRNVGANEYVKEQLQKDNDAARRLGVNVHLTVGP